MDSERSSMSTMDMKRITMNSGILGSEITSVRYVTTKILILIAVIYALRFFQETGESIFIKLIDETTPIMKRKECSYFSRGNGLNTHSNQFLFFFIRL